MITSSLVQPSTGRPQYPRITTSQTQAKQNSLWILWFVIKLSICQNWRKLSDHNNGVGGSVSCCMCPVTAPTLTRVLRSLSTPVRSRNKPSSLFFPQKKALTLEQNHAELFHISFSMCHGMSILVGVIEALHCIVEKTYKLKCTSVAWTNSY